MTTTISLEQQRKIIEEIDKYIVDYSCGCMGDFKGHFKPLGKIFKKHLKNGVKK